jgi:hypothetical protein
MTESSAKDGALLDFDESVIADYSRAESEARLASMATSFAHT